jgi:hypothetical protein
MSMKSLSKERAFLILAMMIDLKVETVVNHLENRDIDLLCRVMVEVVNSQ